MKSYLRKDRSVVEANTGEEFNHYFSLGYRLVPLEVGQAAVDRQQFSLGLTEEKCEAYLRIMESGILETLSGFTVAELKIIQNFLPDIIDANRSIANC